MFFSAFSWVHKKIIIPYIKPENACYPNKMFDFIINQVVKLKELKGGKEKLRRYAFNYLLSETN